MENQPYLARIRVLGGQNRWFVVPVVSRVETPTAVRMPYRREGGRKLLLHSPRPQRHILSRNPMVALQP